MPQTQGWTLWITGLPAAGKTTLARALRARLAARGVSSVLLDSGELRQLLTPRPTYTPAERDGFYNRLADLATWLAYDGENVIIAATGGRRSYRAAARARLAPRFAEVWVRCPASTCRKRDHKRLYLRADTGEIRHLAGADEPYEPPEHAELVVRSDRLRREAAVASMLETIAALERAEPPSLARAAGGEP